ncbi:MAG: NAD(P)H-hydrate dehydratase [Wujia sp.]
MNYVANGQEMLRIDEYTINVLGIPQMVLMERAALGIAEFVKDRFSVKSRVLVVVDSGNNGGDGIAVARMLHIAGYDVEIFWINGLEQSSEGFIQQYGIAKKLRMKFIDEILDYGYDVVIDGIFGVGLNRAVSGKQAEAVAMINEIEGYKISIDIPSGIDAYTGFVHGSAVKADATFTFGLMKLGLLTGQGQEYAGAVTLVDIGVPKQAIDFVEPSLYTYDSDDINKLIPSRRMDTHKGSYGKVAVIGGSRNMAGAVLFAAEAAYRMGCGLVRVCTVDENREIIQSRLPEALLTTYDNKDMNSIREAMKTVLEWSDVIVIGPGLGMGEHATFMLEKVLKNFQKKLVIDADGLNTLALDTSILDDTKAQVILTPHLMEMSRLIGMKTAEIKENKHDIAREFAAKHKVVVVLKDSRTIVSDGGKQGFININGNNGMATGGSGDVLSGIIASLCGQGMNAFEAAKLGVCMHGLAGQEAAIRMGRYSMIAGDIVKSITRVLEEDYYAI